MDEKILVKSKQYNAKKIVGITLGICVAIYVILILSFSSYAAFSSVNFWLLLIGGILVIGAPIYLWLRAYTMVVTDKRIYGKVAWGKRVDLPVDSISATTRGAFKGVSVATSSGKVGFLLIKNADEVYDAISNLIIERQREKSVKIPSAPTTDEADLLKKYKALLENGTITQEKFDTKKKQLLDL